MCYYNFWQLQHGKYIAEGSFLFWHIMTSSIFIYVSATYSSIFIYVSTICITLLPLYARRATHQKKKKEKKKERKESSAEQKIVLFK